MPIYKVKTTCFVGKVVRHKGESFEYNGPQNDHLELVKESATTHSPPKAKPETTIPEVASEIVKDTKQDLEQSKRSEKPQVNKA
ncbi:hypothetical protein [Bartonella sp. OT172YNZD]|uniref:hypothetical protein n=1 Tax=Bartonella sp. OT172YNZD TaxID=3243572 RepID=UPI0035D0759C